MASMGLDGNGHFEIEGHGRIDVMPHTELKRLLERARQQGIEEGKAMTLAEAGGEREEGLRKVREALGLGDVTLTQDAEVFDRILHRCARWDAATDALDKVGEDADESFTPAVEALIESMCEALDYTPSWARG